MGRAVGAFPAAAAVCTEARPGGQGEALTALRHHHRARELGAAMLAWVGRSALFRPPLWCVPRRCPVDNALRCPPYGTTTPFGGQGEALTALRHHHRARELGAAMLAWVGRSAFFRPPLRCAPRRCPVDN